MGFVKLFRSYAVAFEGAAVGPGGVDRVDEGDVPFADLALEECRTGSVVHRSLHPVTVLAGWFRKVETITAPR